MKRIIEKNNKLDGKYRVVIAICFVGLFILISFLALLPKLSIISEIFSENNVFYFPIKDKVVLNDILEDLYFNERISYTITANGFLRVDSPEIARQVRTKIINKGLIPSKLYLFFIKIDIKRDHAIRDTLYKVAKKFNADEDANGDGETNCQDAAIWFYLMYPYREEVKITVNNRLHHAFNTVKIGGIWRCIEPQAFVMPKTYFMEDNWYRYDSTYNKDGSFLLDDYYDYLIKHFKDM